jgi:hypothetical protein
LESYKGYKFKRDDVLVPKEGVDVPDYLKEIRITDVRPAHGQYKGIDLDGDEQRLDPSVLEEEFTYKNGEV